MPDPSPMTLGLATTFFWARPLSTPLMIAVTILTAHQAFSAPPELHEILTHELPDRRVTIERAPGIILPDPPQPVATRNLEPLAASRLAEMAAIWRAHRITHPSIHAGATVYRLVDGTTVTYVSNFSVNNGQRVSFWSSADFSLFAHTGGFKHTCLEGELNYTLLLFCSVYDVAAWQQFMEKRGKQYEMPGLPAFSEGPATWVLTENKNKQELDPLTERTINHLHEHHDHNFAELKQAYAILQADLAVRRAELEANPPQPRDIHLRVSVLSPDQAAAWHQYALAQSGPRQITQPQDGGVK